MTDARADPESAAIRSTSGIEIKPVYGRATSRASTSDERLGQPGSYPFTRGIHADGYRGRAWTMRQYAGFGSAEETNRRFRYLLDQGQTGLSVAFDLPTQMGYDSDDPAVLGEVGRVGVPIDSIADMEILLDGIDLGGHLDLDDDQRDRGHPAGAVRGGGATARRRSASAARDDPERHPQGVHRPRHVHLPAGARPCGW